MFENREFILSQFVHEHVMSSEVARPRFTVVFNSDFNGLIIIEVKLMDFLSSQQFLQTRNNVMKYFVRIQVHFLENFNLTFFS